jgi:hypothetical protein
MVSSSPNPSNTTAVTPANGVAVKEKDIGLALSDTTSTMTKPEPPAPHKHQIHVLIIGTRMYEYITDYRCWTWRIGCRHQNRACRP